MVSQNQQKREQSLDTEDIDTLLIDEESSASPIEVIETVISSLDHNNTAMVRRGEENHRLWKFQYGTIEVFVQITGENDYDTLAVWSSILKLPAKDETRLMRKLLDMNWSETYETAFAIYNNEVVVLTHRLVSDLSAGEISRAITLVATIADDYDEALQAEFGNQ